MAVAYGQIRVKLSPIGTVNAVLGIGTKGGGGGSNDYRDLSNKPSINGHTLIGDSNFEDIGLHFMTNTEIRDLLGGNNNGG